MENPVHPSSTSVTVPPQARIAGLFGAAVLLLGATVLVGWYVHSIALIQLQPTLAPMQYNTALCFVFAGLGLVAAALGRLRQAVPVAGFLLVAIAGVTMAEYLTRANLGIDQLLFRCYVTVQAPNPGRMSPVSAFCFTLAGLAFIRLGLKEEPHWRPVVVGLLASVTVSITAVALIGYALGLPGTYGWGELTRIAMHTAAGLCCVGVALFNLAWNLDLRPGEHTPRWLPVPLMLGVLTSSLILYFALESKQSADIVQTVRAGAESVRSQIEVRMDGRMRAFARMSQRWEFAGGMSRAAWEADAGNYVHDFPDLQAIEWFDANRHLQWIVPLAGNEKKIGMNLTTESRRNEAAARAEAEHQAVITRTVTLFHGGLGYIVYVPIRINGQSQGLIAAVFNAQACLRRYLPVAVASGESIAISESGRFLYQRDVETPAADSNWLVRERIQLHGATWDMDIWPAPELVARLDSPLPAVVLFAGALGSILLGAVCFFAQRASRNATETASANVALRSALDQVKTLEGLLPICSSCKRVRDDSGYWSQIDTYLHQHTNASLSHGYCPECAAKAFREYGFEVPEAVQAEIDAGNYE